MSRFWGDEWLGVVSAGKVLECDLLKAGEKQRVIECYDNRWKDALQGQRESSKIAKGAGSCDVDEESEVESSAL